MLTIERIGQAAFKLSGWQGLNLTKKDGHPDPDILQNFLKIDAA